jgi:pyruvate/2-oxoglutarate dehydrogenase complex dihydrolipoamide acyltransferase (E2) component
MNRHFIILLLALLAGPAWAQTAAPAEAPAAPVAAAAAAAAPAASAPATAASAPATPPPPPAPLDARVQQLKSELVRLNRDLLVLEEELLFPAGTQVAVFVSMDVGTFFELESVQVKMGNQVVGQHLYTQAEVAALKRGGVQRLWLGNLKSGTHAIDAFFTGRGPKQGEHQRDYKRGTTLSFEKTSEPRYIELRIRDAQGKLQPEFDVKVW